ncbi:hypothetical protein EXN66_Car008709 [Channa argus]|uniref:Uncharacterized protein n=1 Tax=Channa argus TaxID=215402 RepID=A0A6G1PS74_CHAAH|nr:hypothetical protein EXN66_Car008709 [Channa argus]
MKMAIRKKDKLITGFRNKLTETPQKGIVTRWSKTVKTMSEQMIYRVKNKL